MNPLERTRAFLREGLWRDEPAGRALRLVYAALRVLVLAAEGFERDRVLLRATALAYFTVLSLIPILVIVLAITKGLGLGDQVAGYVVDQIAAGSPDAKARILELVGGVKLAGLGTFGAATLFLTTVLQLSTIEEAFNAIFGVQKKRPLVRRFSDYLAVLVIAPILLLSALALGTTLNSQWLLQRLLEVPAFAALYAAGLRQLPVVMFGLAFAFLYWFLPNTRVKPVSALIGGIVAGVLFGFAQNAYVSFNVGVARYNMLFQGFAALPLLLVWIYFSWVITLLGVEVVYAHQTARLQRRERVGALPTPAAREALGLTLATEIARRFAAGSAPWTADDLADALRTAPRVVRELLAALEAAGIVAGSAGEERDAVYLLARPAEKLSVLDVLAALRGDASGVAPRGPVGSTVGALLDEVRHAAAAGPGGVTLAMLAERAGAGSVDPAGGAG